MAKKSNDTTSLQTAQDTRPLSSVGIIDELSSLYQETEHWIPFVATLSRHITMGEEVKANGEAKQEDKGVSTEETTQSSPSSKTESKKRSLEEDKDSTAEAVGEKDPSAAENEKDKCEQPKSKKTRTEESIEAPSKEESNDSPPKSIFGSSTSSGFGFGSSALKGTSTDEEKPTSSFGSATGFGSSTGFGSTTSTGFGSSSGFGSSTSSGFKTTPLSAGFGFGNSSSTGSKTVFTLGGSNKDEDSTNNASPSKSTTTPIVALPVSNEPITNGEENEKAIITLRAKLFKLSDVKVKVQAAPSEEKEEKKVGIQMATKVGQNVDSKQADESESSQPAAKKDWKEVGIGPLRVLTDGEHTRIVQRRENTPGGQGTRLILNVPLRKECRVEKPNDKFVKLAAVEIVENDDDDKDSDKKSVKYVPAHFLFKVKTVAEADSLLETLQKYCGNSSGLFKMVKHNNIIPNIHCKKKWHTSTRGPLKVKLALNQASKKKSRRIARAAKAAAMAPRPTQLLRPVVNAPTQRYNAKVRLGRGFTAAELKAAGISPAYARTVGIAVDLRRTSRSVEAMERNVARLNEYKSKLVVFGQSTKEEFAAASQVVGTIQPISKPASEIVMAEVTDEMKASVAFTQMRLARQETRVAGLRIAVEARKKKD